MDSNIRETNPLGTSAVDLTDPRLYADDAPELVWYALRGNPGPTWSEGFRSHWAVTRYEQVVEAYRAGPSLSSESGMHLGEKNTDDAAGEASGGMSLLVTDGAAHAEMRKAIGTAFSPRSVARLRESTLALARGLVAAAVEREVVDFVEAVAAPLPVIVICDLLGVPESDRERVKRLTQEAFSGSGYATSRRQLSAHARLFGYCDHLLDEKRRHPGDDVATVISQATMFGEPIRREVAVMNCHDLISGGNETARHTAASATATMISQPEPWAGLRRGEHEVAAATEEVLRLECPISHVMRRVVEEVEIGGVTMRPGEFVTMWLRSANRDEEVFAEPERLDFGRSPNRHVTFGVGAHYCIAALLARVEISAVIQAMIEMVASVEPAGVSTRLESNFFRGYRTLPVRLRPV